MIKFSKTTKIFKVIQNADSFSSTKFNAQYKFLAVELECAPQDMLMFQCFKRSPIQTFTTQKTNVTQAKRKVYRRKSFKHICSQCACFAVSCFRVIFSCTIQSLVGSLASETYYFLFRSVIFCVILLKKFISVYTMYDLSAIHRQSELMQKSSD